MTDMEIIMRLRRLSMLAGCDIETLLENVETDMRAAGARDTVSPVQLSLHTAIATCPCDACRDRR